MEWLDEAMRMVREKESELSNLDRCLNVRICPTCGSDLIYSKMNYFSPEIFECTDSECGFIYHRAN